MYLFGRDTRIVKMEDLWHLFEHDLTMYFTNIYVWSWLKNFYWNTVEIC